MRELTFAGFLKNYVRELSLSGSTGLYALAREAARNNPRLREPLLLYALFTGQEQTLMKATQDSALNRQFKDFMLQYDRQELESLLEAHPASLPLPYQKVWDSYQYCKNKGKVADETKALMRQRILELQKVYHITNYRLYTDLNLNPGNLNAWLKHGTNDKISLNNARKVLQYLQDGVN